MENEFNFESLPKYMKEKIFLMVGESKEISRLRRICKSWKKVIDESSNTKCTQIKEKREQYKLNKIKFKRKYDLEYFLENNVASCECCLGKSNPMSTIGCGLLTFPFRAIKEKLDFYDCCDVLALFTNFISFLIYYPLLFAIGTLMVMFGLMTEMMRAIFWIFTFGYFCCLNRRKYCHSNLSIYTLSKCRTHEPETSFKFACYTFFCGLSSNNIKKNCCCCSSSNWIIDLFSFLCCCND